MKDVEEDEVKKKKEAKFACTVPSQFSLSVSQTLPSGPELWEMFQLPQPWA